MGVINNSNKNSLSKEDKEYSITYTFGKNNINLFNALYMPLSGIDSTKKFETNNFYNIKETQKKTRTVDPDKYISDYPEH